MSDNSTKSLIIYITVNKDGTINLSLDEPKKEKSKWVIKKYFVNKILYDNIEKIVRKSEMTFDSDPEVIEINIKSNEV